jgi:surfeit locus 1 family protein
LRALRARAGLTASPLPPSPRRRFVVATVAALMAAALTARLGVWQLDRAAQKIALRDAIAARGAMPPLAPQELARNAADAAAQHHRRVRLQGRWQAGHTVFLDNRQMGGRPGFYVVTPLVTSPGHAVLVQRGWLPRDPVDRARLPAVPTPEAPVMLDGRIAPPPARLYEFEHGGTGRIRQNLDLDAFARDTGLSLAPLSVLQLDDAGDGLRREWPVPAFDVHTHRGYAFQWFALSALITALYVWFQLIVPRRRRG